MALAYLLDPCQQYSNLGGNLNVAGWFEVFEYDTDDRATVYTDFDGTLAQEHIVIDNNGRAVMIVDSEKTYRVEMYYANGGLAFTQGPVWTVAGGGGASLVKRTEVVSTDGSIEVEKSTASNVTTFDIGMAPRDDDEYLEWVKCSDTGVSDGTLIPTYVEGSMETVAAQGLAVQKDKFYHITLSVKAKPTGTRNYYDTLSVKLMYKNTSAVILAVFANDIDSSRTGDVLFDYSYDFKATADGCIYLIFDGATVFDNVDCCLQVHRVYSGINSVPGSCATKAWVVDYVDSHGGGGGGGLPPSTQSDTGKVLTVNGMGNPGWAMPAVTSVTVRAGVPLQADISMAVPTSDPEYYYAIKWSDPGMFSPYAVFHYVKNDGHAWQVLVQSDTRYLTPILWNPDDTSVYCICNDSEFLEVEEYEPSRYCVKDVGDKLMDFTSSNWTDQDGHAVAPWSVSTDWVLSFFDTLNSGSVLPNGKLCIDYNEEDIHSNNRRRMIWIQQDPSLVDNLVSEVNGLGLYATAVRD